MAMAEIKPMDEKEIDALTEGASHYAPAVQEKLWQAKMEIRRLKCETARADAAEKASRRWRAMFEHAARLIADEIEVYGLAGDEATEEIAEWVAIARAEKEREP